MTKILVAGSLLVALTAGVAARIESSKSQERTVGRGFRNIKVLGDLPESQLLPAMVFMAASLGVGCEHCHTNSSADDSKPAKGRAREMIAMTRKLQQESFDGRATVNCYTCHRGEIKPARVPSVERASWTPGRRAQSTEPMPNVDQLLERYEKALGGRTRIDKASTLVMKGTVLEWRGSTDPTSATVEIFKKAPNKLVRIIDAPGDRYVEGFDGRVAEYRTSKPLTMQRR